MNYLISLIIGLFKSWFGMKQDAEVSEGKAIQKEADEAMTVDCLQAEAQAAENSPTNKTEMEKLLEEHKL